MKNILIPVDGSVYSQKAMDKGVEFAKMLGANIISLNVKNTLIPYLEPADARFYMDLIDKTSQDILQDAKAYLSYTDGEVSQVSLDGDVASSIIEFIDENEIDLVIMGSQGLGAGKIHGLLIGSVANKVIHNIKKPILIVR